MKKNLSLLLICLMMLFSVGSYAQDSTATSTTDSTPAATTTPEPAAVTETPAAASTEEKTFHQVVKEKFIEGDPVWMAPVLLCMIIGLAVAIERIIVLNLASSNTSKLIKQVEDALNQGGYEAARNLTAATRGPVASIFTQGLLREKEGIEMVEKSVIAYGSVEMGKLERGLVWISLFIALAPMLGFMGTVVGMIGAFDAIEAAGDISPSLVAGGIKVALLTTVAGLIVAIILQLFYNYCVSKIDALVGEMEEASIAFVDVLVKHSHK